MRRAALIVWAGLLASPVLGGMQVVLDWNSANTFRGYGVGAFTASGGPAADWQTTGIAADYGSGQAVFKTYCVEIQTFNPGTKYDVTIDDTIKYDGVEHAPSAVTRSAYAYYRAGQFTSGEVDTVSENRALQALFWDMEGVDSAQAGYEKDNYNALSSAERSLYVSYYTDALNTHAQAGLVRVMNVWDVGHAYESGSHDRQSQLCMVVSAPAAGLLGALGLGLVVWIKRRMS